MISELVNGKPYAIDKLGFGIYHFAQGGVDSKGYKDSETFAHDGKDRIQCDYQENLDYMNFYIYRLDRSCHEHLRRIKEKGCVTWVYYEPFVKVSIKGKESWQLKAGWKENITKQVDEVKKAGLWDVVAGFQYDEPLTREDTDVFEEFTEFMATFGKRQMAIFSIYEIYEDKHPCADDPEYGIHEHVITPKSCRFLTDVGFDWYSHADYEKFEQTTNDLIKMMGRDNLYIWQVPCTWTRGNNPNVTEDFCLENLEVLYKLLKNCKHPGGLFCYTWRSWSKPDGLDYKFDTSNKERWSRLEQRMMEIGRELRDIKLDDIDLYSHLLDS